MPELMPAPYFPLVRAVDAAPAAQTEHWASHKVKYAEAKNKNNMAEIFFIPRIRDKYTTFRNYNKVISLNRPQPRWLSRITR